MIVTRAHGREYNDGARGEDLPLEGEQWMT